MLEKIEALRKQLHSHPESSGQEKGTATRIENFISEHNPTKNLKNLGNHGLAAIYAFGNKGPTIVIRCELDALPIEENNSIHLSIKNKRSST